MVLPGTDKHSGIRGATPSHQEAEVEVLRIAGAGLCEFLTDLGEEGLGAKNMDHLWRREEAQQ